MRAVWAYQLAGCRDLQTLRDVAAADFPTAARSHDMVQGLLRADGALVCVLCICWSSLHHRSAGRSRHVPSRSSSAGRHNVLHGYCIDNSLRYRRVPAAEAVGLGLWTGLDLYRANQSLLYAGLDTFVDPLD